MVEFDQYAIAVVPCAMARRGCQTEVAVGDRGVAQSHLATTIDVDRIVETAGSNIGPVALRQIRERLADRFGI